MMPVFRPRMAGQERHRGYATDEIAACARRIGLTSSPGESDGSGRDAESGGPGGRWKRIPLRSSARERAAGVVIAG
jgi:hypothetical protein